MKRAIRLLPTLFLLPLLGFVPNGQRVEKVEAVSTSYRYFIATEGATYGIESSSSRTVYNNLSKPFVFEEATGGYRIKNLIDNKYIVHNNNDYVVSLSSTTTDYVSVWNIGIESGHTYLKSTNNRYLCLNSSTWRSFEDFDSKAYLSIFSVEEDAASFVTAMNNIACTDLVNGPAKTGENSWESAATAFNGLQQPTKNYLKTLASDKTKGTIDTVEKALAKYDYIVNKYNKLTTQYTEFIDGRDTSGLVTSSGVKSFNSIVSNTPIIIATVLVAVLSLTSVVLVKRKNK